MSSEKVQLAAHAASYSIEVDLHDLNPDESLSSRYERYLLEQTSQRVPDASNNSPVSTAPAPPVKNGALSR